MTEREREFYFCEVSSGVFLSTTIAIKSAGSNFSPVWSPLCSVGNAEAARGCMSSYWGFFVAALCHLAAFFCGQRKICPYVLGQFLHMVRCSGHPAWVKLPWDASRSHWAWNQYRTTPWTSKLQEGSSPLLLHRSLEYLLETAKERASYLLLLHLEVLPRKCSFSV